MASNDTRMQDELPKGQKVLPPLEVATYNIHGGVGTDRRYDVARISTVINSLQCRVVALQEVHVWVRHRGDTLATLVDHTGMEAIAGITVFSSKSHFGNVILTDLPVTSIDRYDLSISGFEKRGAIDVHLQYHGLTLRVLATHLGLMPYERRLQVKRVLQILRQKARPEEVITVLMGDINEWFLWGRPLQWIHQFFGHPGNIGTFPVWLPLLALDRIWCHPPESMLRIEVCRSRLAQVASDHLPLKAAINVAIPESTRSS